MKKEASFDADGAPPPPPPNSTSIISSLLRAELNMHAKQQAWDKIEQMLDKNPDVTRAVDPTNGELPLHVLARKCNVRTLAIDLAILSNPEGLLHRDLNGQIPLHSAAESGGVEGLKIIYEAYKDGRKCSDNVGRLPIHVAAEAKSKVAICYLLDQDPTLTMSAIQQKTDNVPEDQFLGGLPIHCACRSGASEEIIDVLLSKNDSCAKVKDTRGNLPIHSLLKHGTSVEFGSIKALISAYPSSLKKKNSAGDTPLVIALKHGAKSEDIEYLLKSYPEAAKERSGDGRSPLIIAIENHSGETSILNILEHSPAFATAIDENTRLLPIEIATRQRFSPRLIHYLLLEDLPINLNDRGPEPSPSYRSSYQHSWEHLISNDEYSEVVSNLFQSCTHAQRIALAKAPCRLSEKPLLEVASPKCKRALLVGMRLFGIIELTDYAPAFVTDRTSIYYGLQYSETLAKGVSVIFEEEGESQATDLRGVATPVIVKLTPYRELMEKELSVRRDYQLSFDYVPRIYSVHYCEVPSPVYCISMEQGLTLENILLQMKEMDANASIPKEDIRQIGMALLHLHDKGLVHGDFGSHNVGKFDDGGKYKLLSLGGAVPVGKSTDANRGFYFSPEIVSTKTKKLKLKSKPKLVSIEAAHTQDTWAFGVMMYQLLSGVPLSVYARSVGRNANATRVNSWNEKALSKALIDLRVKDEAAADLLSGLLQPKPSRRIASMAEVLAHRFFSYEEQKAEKAGAGTALAPTSPEEPAKLSEEVDGHDFMMKNLSGTTYPTQERRLQADVSVDDTNTHGNIDEVKDEASHEFGGSSLSQEDAKSFFSYPVQDLRSTDPNSSYPIQERRSIFPVQEMKANIAAESPRSNSLPVDISGDQSVSSSLLGSNSACRFDGDCFSTASTKFADNTSATIEAMKREVPTQVVATEKKLERRDFGNGGKNEQHSQCLLTVTKDVNTLHQAESYNSIGSDDESEPGRIIPGSRLRKRTTAQKYNDPQLI